ncbi:MAG: FHA domain-containing protein [Deltaproteobacteria bacterium]|nr:FHA domain-containing protein [Deltaproteobacteria bacterium]
MQSETHNLTIARLVVIEGMGQGAIFPLFDRQVLIGRLSNSDLPLDDSSVSRLHARLFYRDGCYFIEDLGSRAGTLVNGQPISGHRVLGHGDEIQIGSVRLRYQH